MYPIWFNINLFTERWRASVEDSSLPRFLHLLVCVDIFVHLCKLNLCKYTVLFECIYAHLCIYMNFSFPLYLSLSLSLSLSLLYSFPGQYDLVSTVGKGVQGGSSLANKVFTCCCFINIIFFHPFASLTLTFIYSPSWFPLIPLSLIPPPPPCSFLSFSLSLFILSGKAFSVSPNQSSTSRSIQRISAP